MMVGEVAPVFAMYYQSHFAQRFGEEVETVMFEYAAQVQLNGLKRADVERGIFRIRQGKGGKWLPNPIEFIELCKPIAEDLGLPSQEDVAVALDRNIAWNRRHACKRFQHEHRMSALIARDILPRYRMADSLRRDKLLAESYAKWLEVARAKGLPEEMSAIAEMPEPRSTTTEYVAKNGLSELPRGLAEQINRIRRMKKVKR